MRKKLNTLIENNFASYKGLVRLLLTEIQFITGNIDSFTATELSSVKRFVFVCLGNINRSAYGHALAASHGLPVASFGLSTTTGVPAFQRGIEVAAELGTDLNHHHATNLPDFKPQEGDLYLVMEMRHAQKLIAKGFPPQRIVLLGAWSKPQRLHLHDPHEHSREYFHSCFTLIRSAVENISRQYQTTKN